MILSLLAATALAGPSPECALPDVLSALQGNGPAPHAVALEPPWALRARSDPAPPDGRPIQGTRMDHHVDSEHFTVAWTDGRGDETSANAASDALERAWVALVDEHGFRAPVSSEDFLLWVVLEPDLGAVGLTTEYENGRYPEGYPVIFLDPSWATDVEFWESVVTHEFAHAIQFAYRDYSGSSGEEREPWYWEASAEWSVALARPDLEVYAASSRHYATATAEPHWVMQDAHQYGMFVVNAYLEENVAGAGSMRAVWEAGARRADQAWHALIAEEAGRPPAAVFGGAAVSYAMGQLADSELYWPATSSGPVEDGATGTVGWLGARLFVADADATVAVNATQGGVNLAAPGEVGRTVQIRAGEVLAVVGTQDRENGFVLDISPPVSGGGGSSPGGEDERSVESGVSSGFGSEPAAGCASVPGRPRMPMGFCFLGISAFACLRMRATGPCASRHSV
ncbi:MAG: DUF6055 domain-containing protein [Myxococcota bacterium]|nr:DUF6055 domain-containing protein [Myxococcota bacterium]